MECWGDGFKGIKTYLAFTTHYSITPTFPGPDLTCNELIAYTQLMRYRSDNIVFHASCARAGHHFI
jgi:hypothetical protein